MKFSKTKKAFYPVELLSVYQAAGSLPADLQDITQAAYAALVQAQATGKVIDWTGSVPVAVTPPPVAPVVPASVSPAQAKIALARAGLLDQVELIVGQADIETKIAWKESTSIERNSPTVTALATALNLTSSQLDALFTVAASVKV